MCESGLRTIGTSIDVNGRLFLCLKSSIRKAFLAFSLNLSQLTDAGTTADISRFDNIWSALGVNIHIARSHTCVISAAAKFSLLG